jgi:hypothetical protein
MMGYDMRQQQSENMNIGAVSHYQTQATKQSSNNSLGRPDQKQINSIPSSVHCASKMFN